MSWFSDAFERLYARRDPVTNPPPGELGMDGDAFADFEAGGPDINPELSGRQKYDIYDHMRFTDPAVRANLLMYKLPALAATWSCEPRAETAEDKLVAAAVTKQFGIGTEEEGWLDAAWAETVRQAMYFLDFGSMFEEIVWGDTTKWKPDPASGDEERIYRPIDRLAPRYPRTIVEYDARGSRPLWIQQDLYKAQRIPDIKLCHFVFEPEGASIFGTSLLRSMYGPWRLKKALLISSGLAYDRYSSGVPVVRHPAGQEYKARQIGRNYRTHERAWITFEGPKPPAGEWDLEIVGGSGSIADPTALLNFHDEQMSLGALTMFSKLGTTQTGARAVGEVLQDPFYLAVTSVVNHVRDQRLKFVVRRFVDVNFGPEFDLPKLMVSKIEADNTERVLSAIGELAGAGWNVTYRELVDFVAERMGWPAPPEGHPLKEEGAPVAEGEEEFGGEGELEVEQPE